MYYTEIEIAKFISALKEGYTLSHSGSDAHTYGGLSHWTNELYFESSSQKFYNYSEFWVSSYNSEPQKTTTEITEDEIIKILSGKRNWEVRVSISKKTI